MDQTEYDGAQLLAPLREVSTPEPSAADVQRAIRTGRRRIRGRLIAGLVAVAALVAVAVPALMPGTKPLDGAAAPTEFGGLQQAFTVGSAAGYTPLLYETGRYRQQVFLVEAGHPDDRVRAMITLYATGVLFQDGDPTKPWQPGNDGAPNVNGHPAYWHPPTPRLADGSSVVQRSELAWQWADGGWAFVTMWKGDGSRDQAHRIAETVAPATGNIDVTFPFTIPQSVVDADQLTGAIVSYGPAGRADGRLLAGLLFPDDVLTDGAHRSLQVPLFDRLLVGVQQELHRDPLNFGQLRIPADLDNRTVQLAAGFWGVADFTSHEDDPPGLTQRLTELAHAVRLVGNPTNPNSWVSDPLR
jgi:hypothetical protein